MKYYQLCSTETDDYRTSNMYGRISGSVEMLPFYRCNACGNVGASVFNVFLKPCPIKYKEEFLISRRPKFTSLIKFDEIRERIKQVLDESYFIKGKEYMISPGMMFPPYVWEIGVYPSYDFISVSTFLLVSRLVYNSFEKYDISGVAFAPVVVKSKSDKPDTKMLMNNSTNVEEDDSDYDYYRMILTTWADMDDLVVSKNICSVCGRSEFEYPSDTTDYILRNRIPDADMFYYPMLTKLGPVFSQRAVEIITQTNRNNVTFHEVGVR